MGESRKGSGGKAFLLCLLVLVLAAAAAVWFWYIPTEYELAMAKKEAGHYDEAITALNIPSMISYKDSLAQIAECETGVAYQAAKVMAGEGRYEEAAAAFRALGSFLDSAEQAEAAEACTNANLYTAAKALFEEGKYEEALSAFTALGSYEDSADQASAVQDAINQQAYDAAKALFDEGKYEEALSAFTALGSFGDSVEQVIAVQDAINQQAYAAAKTLYDEGKYEEAEAAFTALGSYGDSAKQVVVAQVAIKRQAYNAANDLLATGKYAEAAEAFTALGSFRDSNAKAAKALQHIPGVVLNASRVSTRIGETATVTATLRSISNPASLTVTASEATQSIVQRGDSFYLITSIPAELVNKTIRGNVMTLTFEGSASTGTRDFTIAGADGTVYATVTVSNTGISDSEATNAGKVNYISDRGFFLYDDEHVYVLNFSLKDASENRIAAPAFVSIRIVNSDGLTVYDQKRYITAKDFGTWTGAFYGSRYMAGVRIAPEDITEGKSTSGTVFFTVELPGYFSFSESQVSASELPTYDATRDCSLDAPAPTGNSPVSLKYRSTSAVQITDLKYEFIKRNNGNVDLKLSFSGSKTYDSQGSGHSGTCYIGFKLFDPEGYVLESGTINTTSVAEGEKFRNVERTFYDIAPGAYRLVLMDVD